VDGYIERYSPNLVYNAASQPTQIMTSCAGSTCYPITYQYDPNTMRTTQHGAALSKGTISGTLTWNPNGSLQKLVIADPLNSADVQTCTYGADDLSRIASVNCVNGATNVWAQTFSYDAFGNITKSGSISWMPGYNSSTNHYALGGTSYDADGNVTNDTFNQYTWDAEGKPLSAGGNTFVYDAFGHRVEWSINGHYENSFVTIGRYKASAVGQTPFYSEFPFPGGSLASEGGGLTAVQLADWLGTTRAAYSYTGGNFIESMALAPFGETYVGGPQNFTGQWSDGDAGNTTFYFPERQYRSSQGRWLSPDPAGVAAVNPSNPQTWNRYAYALNNPLRYTDPLGLYCQWDDGTRDDEESDGGAGFGDCENQGGTWIDTTTITVNGDQPDGPAFENGEQIFPDTIPLQPTFGNCVKSGTDYFSLQHGLQAASGGTLGNSWVSSAFLGSSVSSAITPAKNATANPDSTCSGPGTTAAASDAS
jgi:RHS repeat-associated protein